MCFYERDDELLDRLMDYVARALRSGGSAIVIATPEHTHVLEHRLCGTDLNLPRAILEDRYIRLDAETTLARFMVGGRPDAALFLELLSRPLRRAGAEGRPIYLFGEMVARLWERGETDAAIELEQIGNQVLAQQPMSLLCAYPRRVLGRDLLSAGSRICACHSGVIGLRELEGLTAA